MLAVELPNARYVRAALRQRRIPDFWLEDAAQDVMLECWLAGSPWIGWAVINAARRYGPYKRGGTWRIIPGPLPHENLLPLLNPYPAIEARLDAQRMMAKLTPEQRHWLIVPEDHKNSTQVKRMRARRKLRALMDGTWVDKRRRDNPHPRKGKEREARLARTRAGTG